MKRELIIFQLAGITALRQIEAGDGQRWPSSMLSWTLCLPVPHPALDLPRKYKVNYAHYYVRIKIQCPLHAPTDGPTPTNRASARSTSA